jgi:hypothetical protein
MEAKEKAKKLVDRYDYTLTYVESKAKAKQCALIAVDEIIKANPTNPLTGGYIQLYSDMIDEAIAYWQEVKEEINKL